jgi:hypothetical protein
MQHLYYLLHVVCYLSNTLKITIHPKTAWRKPDKMKVGKDEKQGKPMVQT